ETADNPRDNDVENRADHHAAHSAEQHEDVGLTKQHPDHQSPDEGAKDAGDREAPGKQDVTSLTHVCYDLPFLSTDHPSPDAHVRCCGCGGNPNQFVRHVSSRSVWREESRSLV